MEIQTQNLSSLHPSLLFPDGLDDDACCFFFFFSPESQSDDNDDPVFSHKSLTIVTVFPGYTLDATK